MNKNIKQIKKELGIGNRDIADAFGYANANSFATSHRRKQIESGIEWFYSLIKSEKSEGEKRKGLECNTLAVGTDCTCI